MVNAIVHKSCFERLAGICIVKRVAVNGVNSNRLMGYGIYGRRFDSAKADDQAVWSADNGQQGGMTEALVYADLVGAVCSCDSDGIGMDADCVVAA